MDPKLFNKSTTFDDDQIVVKDSAKKHEAEFSNGRRKPTDADIRTAFRAAVKYGGVPTHEADKTWKWEESGMDNSQKPPRVRKRNNICFSVENNKAAVFHYHKGFYG